MSRFSHIGVLGAGAWGTALATLAERAGRKVTLAGRGEHERATNTDVLLIAVPAQAVREVLAHLNGSQPVVICAKGIEQGTGLLLSEIRPDLPTAILSGPNIASEIIEGLPAATVIAAASETLAHNLCAALTSPMFRCYPATDITGVALAGAMKNVLSIAIGVGVGRGLGENTRAALIARSLAEMTRLAKALGGRAETIMGLAGVGDLSLTTNRNYKFGIALGRGEKLEGQLTEGVFTAKALLLRAAKHGIEVPLAAAVEKILSGEDINKVIMEILARPIPEGE